MAMKFYNFACKLAGIEKIRPENRDFVLNKLNQLSPRELGEAAGIKPESAASFCSLLNKNPSPMQTQFLKALYDLAQKHEDRALSTREISNYLGTSYSSLYYHVNLKFLELMGAIKVSRRVSMTYYGYKGLPALIKVNLDAMKRYWPDIEEWNTDFPKPINKRIRAKRGERIEQALKILGKSSVEELSKADIEKIDSLGRGDWTRMGLNISPYALSDLKKRLRKYVLQ